MPCRAPVQGVGEQRAEADPDVATPRRRVSAMVGPGGC